MQNYFTMPQEGRFTPDYDHDGKGVLAICIKYTISHNLETVRLVRMIPCTHAHYKVAHLVQVILLKTILNNKVSAVGILLCTVLGYEFERFLYLSCSVCI